MLYHITEIILMMIFLSVCYHQFKISSKEWYIILGYNFGIWIVYLKSKTLYHKHNRSKKQMSISLQLLVLHFLILKSWCKEYSP